MGKVPPYLFNKRRRGAHHLNYAAVKIKIHAWKICLEQIDPSLSLHFHQRNGMLRTP
jgi:hypothetical protein